MADHSAAARRASPFAEFPADWGPTVAGLRLSEGGPAARFILRGTDAVAVASGAFGVAIPTTPLRAAAGAGRAALWLGPDEWLLLGPAGEADALAASLAAALADVPHSLVDVSHRQTGLVLEGPGAALALNAAVPLDLSLAAFPVGMAARTIFEKAEIVLWRTDPERFHVEVWRSFAPYVRELLDIVRRENAVA
ncbi:sarcosine oxidase subunit gamma [Alsobacter metallidurans]|uniref:Sarcosine oxidase subunit gamma n=1 Tax=Alsobacter metallidurans TaxID=340221 RepID=A0A917I7Y2_9HYPH|nr:sarcosine oxidase subunit gamma family protein [Alsobacter metallidurans]GGH21040.1 sarcosine oxidase subunit gamma [Alsobacter metallidurans]